MNERIFSSDGCYFAAVYLLFALLSISMWQFETAVYSTVPSLITTNLY